MARPPAGHALPTASNHGGVSLVPANECARQWGSSGLAYLTGPLGGPPDFSRANVLERARQLAADAASLLTGRAALLGLTRAGRVSAGGATHLVAARDGWCAITLSRPDDIAAVPALLSADAAKDDPWPGLHRWAATRPASQIVERATLLDIPAATLGEAAAAPPRRRPIAPRAPVNGPAGLLVADLSSMWAGPLCGQLLARAGATVVKVESPARPDGTRAGHQSFFDWINGAKLSYCLHFDRQADELRDLLAVADIVIEGSRSEALARRRLGPDDIAPRAGRSGCGSPVTDPNRDGRRSATTPRWLAGWSAPVRCSAGTRSSTRWPGWRPAARCSTRWTVAAVSSLRLPWPRSPRPTRRCRTVPRDPTGRYSRRARPRSPGRPPSWGQTMTRYASWLPKDVA